MKKEFMYIIDNLIRTEMQYSLFVILILLSSSVFAQNFQVEASGVKTFTFNDSSGRSQATFHSVTPLQDFTGLTTDIRGKVTFNIKDLAGSLQGKVIIPVSSLATGISKRDEDLKGSRWLDEDQYPNISFTIKKVTKIEIIDKNKLITYVTGDFKVHGVSKEMNIKTTLTYLVGNDKTAQIGSGDLLGVQSEFSIHLSDFNINNFILGKRVSEKIDIKINLVGHSQS